MKTFKNLFQKSSQRIEQRIEDFKDFDPEAYLKLNPDVREAGVDPLLHYINHGRSEKRAFTFPPFECFENKA